MGLCISVCEYDTDYNQTRRALSDLRYDLKVLRDEVKYIELDQRCARAARQT